MPKFLESQLREEAAKKGFTGRRADRYVYGAMNNDGVMHGNKETAKGKALEAKHEADQAAAKTVTPQKAAFKKKAAKGEY